MAYWDTSCLIKLYAPEPDSAEFTAMAIRSASIVTSEITRFELHAALSRKEATDAIAKDGARLALAAFDRDVSDGMIAIWPLDLSIAQRFDVIIHHCYSKVPPILIRTLDAIHIATALVAGEQEMVATDKRLVDAALELNFAISSSL